jgi:hypothetical protein
MTTNSKKRTTTAEDDDSSMIANEQLIRNTISPRKGKRTLVDESPNSATKTTAATDGDDGMGEFEDAWEDEEAADDDEGEVVIANDSDDEGVCVCVIFNLRSRFWLPYTVRCILSLSL